MNEETREGAQKKAPRNKERPLPYRVYFVQGMRRETLETELYLALCYNGREAREMLAQLFTEQGNFPPANAVAWLAFRGNTHIRRIS